MKFDIVNTNLKFSDKVIILPLFEKKIENYFGDENVYEEINSIITQKFFLGKYGEIFNFFTGSEKKIKIILLGLGKKDELNPEKLYEVFAKSIKFADSLKFKEVNVVIPKFDNKITQNIIETSLLATYRYDEHKSKPQKAELEKIIFNIKNDKKDLDEIKLRAQSSWKALCFARDLSNAPSNKLTPDAMANEAIKIGKENNLIKVKIFNEEEIKNLGLELFYSVSKGSDEDAKMIILDYTPKKYNKTLVLVGKGLTFDAGGVSIKPSQNMHEMKMDMSGGSTVLGVFKVLKDLKPQCRIIGAIGSTENLPGHKAQKPGDIWKSYNGKTVEVIDTDAEGRLVLADVLSYVQKQYKADYIIDIATLTGACVVALGCEYTGLFSNDNKLEDMLVEASKDSFDKVWPMPIDDSFHEELKSDVADLKNLGGRYGGASSAAAFLEEFVDKGNKWAHLDIAGTGMVSNVNKSYLSKGATGSGVKLLLEFINNNC